MARFISTLVICLAIAGCAQVSTEVQTDTTAAIPAGTGAIILSAKTRAALSKSARRNEPSLVFAVDRSTRLEGYLYCADGRSGCEDWFGPVVPSHIESVCRPGGRYGCGRFSEGKRIVWNGPVFALNDQPLQSVPFHGIWPLRVTSPKASTGELRAKQGKLTVSAGGIGSDCAIELTPTGHSAGSFAIGCPNGRSLRGTYRSRQNKRLTGRVYSAGGLDIRLTVLLDQGLAAF